jgi:hypothetical protein
VLVVAAMLLLMVLGVQPAHAQAVRGKILSVGIGGVDGERGMYRAGTWVPVLVRLENRSGKVFSGRLAAEQQLDLDGDKVLCMGPSFVLQPNDVEGRDFWTYYWPRPDDSLNGINSVLIYNEDGTQLVSTVTTPDKRLNATGLPPMEDGRRSQRYVLLLGARPMGWGTFTDAWGGTEAVRFNWVRSPGQIPDDAKGLDGVDVIVWQADAVKVSDIAPEFQLKAMLEWVRGGGHLIISVGTQGQEFLKAGNAITDAMPLAITGTRELPLEELALADIAGMSPLKGNKTTLVQAVGTLKPGARAVTGTNGGDKFKDNPLAVTGLYGQGVITVLTIDAGNPEIERRMMGALTERGWMEFWNRVAGWQSIRDPKTAAEIEQAQKAGTEVLSRSPQEIRLGSDLVSSIDVTEVTATRVLVTVLFLGAYWLLAGPVGHLVLRYYKVVHWSWWIFGATVLVATSLAGVVVLVLHVTTYDLRHRTFVLGTVNNPQVSVLGFYGIYAPASGALELQQPAGTGSEVNYLVPLCMPGPDEIKGYADPQSYTLDLKNPNVVSPIFRNTLKKMQGRWVGERPGLSGDTAFTSDRNHPIKGELTNNTGYTLQDVMIVTYGDTQGGRALLYDVNVAGGWKPGERVDLEKGLALSKIVQAGQGALPLQESLRVAGWKLAKSYATRLPGGNMIMSETQKRISDVIDEKTAEDLLFLLLDLRNPDRLLDANDNIHHEPVRGVGRWLDRTKALRASGALIIARAGNVREAGQRVPAPVTLKVNAREVPGQGEVLFAWSMPMAGAAPVGSAGLGIEQGTEAGDAAPAGGPAGRAGRPGVEAP